MSFSSEVRQELSERTDSARHCRIAFLAAVFHGCGMVLSGRMAIRTENESVFSAAVSCLQATVSCPVRTDSEGSEGHSLLHTAVVASAGESRRLAQAMKMEACLKEGSPRGMAVDRILLQKQCCRKAFLRGMFLLSGSVSNPEKSYHLEIVCPEEEEAQLVRELLLSLGFDAKTVQRQRKQVVYLKEGEQISDLLGEMGAPNSLMKLENVRIVRDIAGSVNRRVNCETANLQKTVDASVRQIRDIEYLRDHGEFEHLSPQLRSVAELRLQMPDATLRELSEAIDPPVGRSGINHRLHRLSEMAERLKEGEEGRRERR